MRAVKTINKYIDIFSGILFIFVSVILFILTAQIVQRASTHNTVGPQFIPKVIAVLIIIFSALLIMTGIKRTKQDSGETGSFPEDKGVAITVLITLAVLVLYVSLLKTLGFILASVLFLGTMFTLLDINWKKHIIRNLIIAIVVPILSYLIFRYMFSLTLPTGFLF